MTPATVASRMSSGSSWPTLAQRRTPTARSSVTHSPALPELDARDYHTRLRVAHDGIELAVTVLQPALAEGAQAPLVLHGHGFGGSRLTARGAPSLYETLSGGALPSTDAARRAADAGYFVLSFDHRGFGDSDGHVHIMDPDIEGRDIIALLDWAETDMPHSERLVRCHGRIRVGALGLSYGGAFQLTGALRDPRFAAIIPTATWHDLRYSLAPANVVKTVWGAALVALGLPTSGVKLDKMMYAALAQALVSPLTGRGLSDTVAGRLYANSPAAVFDSETPEALSELAADVLLVQGVGDTLFNLNEALANAKGLARAGRDVHLVVMRHGHSLPFLEDINRIAFETDAHVHLGQTKMEMSALALAYLDWKLKADDAPAGLPRVAVVLDEATTLAFDALPEAHERRHAFQGEAATGGLDVLRNMRAGDTFGGFKRLARTTAANMQTQFRAWLDQDTEARDAHGTGLVARLINALPAHHLDELASGGTFIHLVDIDDDDQALVGIPTIDIQLSGGGPSPVVFVGIGIQREGEAVTQLVNDQIRPIRSAPEASRHTLDLNGVAVRLAAGDRVGLLVYGYHPQFLASFSAIPGHVEVDGHVGLPFVSVAAHRMA